MAIINNHSSINLDANFQGKHTELLQYFYNKGMNIEINDDFAGLKTFLTSLYKGIVNSGISGFL